MKKVILTIIFAFICSLLFIDNVKADEKCYGLYYDDELGYWSPEYGGTFSEPPYRWYGSVFCFTEANGVIGAPGKVSMNGTEFFDEFLIPNVMRSETALSSDVQKTLSALREGWKNTTVHINYDYSEVIEYFNKTGEFPPYIHFYYRTNENFLDYFSGKDAYVYFKLFIDDFIAESYDNFDKSIKENKRNGTLDGKTILDFYIGLSPKVDLNQCFGLDYYIEKLQAIADGQDNSCYSLDFIDFKEELQRKCDAYVRNHPTPANGVEHMCTTKCDQLSKTANDMCNIKDEKNKCGIGPKTMGWFMRILKIGRYIIPVLVIILSILDFITAIASGEDDALKKAGTKFARRIVVAIIIFLLPAFLQFLFDTFKIKGLNSGNPYCMK